MQAADVTIAPESSEALLALYEGELRRRRVFVKGSFNLADRQRCSFRIIHPGGAVFTILAEAVYIKAEEPGAGVGLELTGLDPSQLAELDRFVHQASQSEATESEATDGPGPRNLYERIRKLSTRERESTARQGTMAERVALERTYGGSVWEALLQNPQLSVAEVAHVAKNGTLPIPLVSVIVANGGWLASGEVRRALLSNPRATGGHLERILRATPRAELKQIAQASPYRNQVRALAKKLMGE